MTDHLDLRVSICSWFGDVAVIAIIPHAIKNWTFFSAGRRDDGAYAVVTVVSDAAGLQPVAVERTAGDLGSRRRTGRPATSSPICVTQAN